MAMVESAKPDFGARMKRVREERGVTLRTIADTTKISIGFLEALERNDISRLPGGIFSRGIVRSYAIEIGLDPEQAVREFIGQFPHDSVTAGSPHVAQHDYEAEVRPRRTPTTVIAVVAISLLIGVILLLTFRSR